MTDAADLVLTNAEVHTLTEPDRTAEAVAVRDGAVVRVDTAYEVGFLEGAETRVVDLDGRVLLPGFIDAHTHLTHLGRRLVHADLSGAASREECVERLAARAAETDPDEWILGYGYDESRWAGDGDYLAREDLEAVSETRPVVAFREDMHVASVNGVVLERFLEEMPAADVRRGGGGPTGVVVESALDVVYEAVEPGPGETRDLVLAAQAHAHERGVTGVHEMVRDSHAPRVYRDLELEGELGLRVRLNYWSDHLDAIEEVGLRTNHGSALVRTGAVKTYTDGTFGGRTAKLSAPYADGGDGNAETGQWVVAPDELRGLVARADAAGLQVAAHAIGDEAVEATLAAYEDEADDAGAARHRIEHAELLGDEHVERFAASGVVASVQPNFLKWAGDGGLYDARLGPARTARTNRYADLLAAGVPLAFGSDCMPLGPLFGIHRAVNTTTASQRLEVTEALRAYTLGSAYAGFDEGHLGTIEPGKKADLVALDRSPWEHHDDIENIDVALTVVDGEVVYDGR